MIDHLLGDRYRIQRKLGEGGMAIVYLAIDEKLGRNVAIKVLREKFQNHAEVRTRFQHEARAISAFDHTNILKVFDYSGPNSTQLWIVTELIHGRNLGQIVETAPGGWLHPVIASCIVRETSKALALAHSQGVVHRDVKPENVMITQAGVVKLMDFGIAKIQSSHSMTQTGMFMGSPSYMSSEQVRGRDVDHRSDIYSLGVLFYELVTGKLPFAGQSTADVAMKILNGQFQHPKFIKEHVPNEINDLILSMMALDPANRPQSTDSVAGVIDRFLELQGYESSSAELERCFRDPKQYGERLAKLSKQTMVVALPTQLLKSNQRVLEATKLPDHADAVTKMVRSYNEKAIDTPQPYIPTKSFNELSRKNASTSKINIPPPPMRRDHKLPKRSIPQLGKKTATAVHAIVHNLPERRLDPRNIAHEYSEIKKADGFGSQKIVGSHQVSNPQHRTAQVVVEIKSENNSQNQKPRPFKPPRSIPKTPHKPAAKPAVRYQYAVKRGASKQGRSFIKMIVALTLISIFVVTFSSQENFDGLKEHFLSNKKYIISILKGTNNQKTLSQELGQSHSEATSHSDQSTLPVSSPSEVKTDKVKSAPGLNTTVKFDYNLGKSKNNAPTPKVSKIFKKPDKLAAKDKSSTLKIANTPNEGKYATKTDMTPPVGAPVENTVPIVEKPPVSKNEKVVGHSEIQISSSPAAKIFIDGKLSGTTNDKGTSSKWIKIKPGSIKIELKRDGFLTKTETITIKSQDKKVLGPYSLEKDNGVLKSASNYRLTLSSNTLPVEVIVVNTETKVTTSFTLRSATQNLSLAKGVYDVTIDNNGEVFRRRVDLSNTQPQMTFNAIFKNNLPSSTDKNRLNKDDGGTSP